MPRRGSIVARTAIGPFKPTKLSTETASWRLSSDRSMAMTATGAVRMHPTLRRRRPTYNEDLVTRVASLVELERRLKQEEPPPIGVRVANTKFWAKMRDILFVNRTAVGVEQLDDLMTAVIRDDSDAAQDFNGLIIRLPPTSLQQTGRASSSHPAFEEMMRDEGLKD
ncbi:hypothetical protein PC110_g1309 [Phytophthora cactorum]|uniref:Uncharacterized protein n=1 Tax=Phytophthora cactorum TaxID=29920 RepID=A0A329T1K8_9STRA|nr:hypothetical protein PC110_g1309 [Phytophthora cactorum]